MNDGTKGTVSIYCEGRYGWNIYANKPNLHNLEDVIKMILKIWINPLLNQDSLTGCGKLSDMIKCERKNILWS